MRAWAALLAFIPFAVEAQGILKSRIIGGDTAVITLTVRDFESWGDPIEHEFVKGTATYLDAGDHLLRYEHMGRLLHTEWVHVTRRRQDGNARWMMDKRIMLWPRRLTEMDIRSIR